MTERSPIGRFGPLREDHPSVGDLCPACHQPMLVGDVPSLVDLAPADAEEAAKQRAGAAYNAVAAVVHERCAWPGEGR